MLKLILGVSGTGKTDYVLQQIKARANAQKYSLLIVPEQFSSGSEAMLYNYLGDEKIRFAHALSFTALCEKIFSTYGGTAQKTLTDAMRTALVRRTAAKLGSTLTGFARNASNIVFCTMCAEAIKELKTAGVSPQDLQAASRFSNQKEKLNDLATVYAAFNVMCENIALDATDRILRAADIVQADFFEDKEIYIDGFDGFTFPEYQMLQKLLCSADCTVSLCCDAISDNEGGLGLFSQVKKTGERLRAIAARKDVSVAVPQILTQDFRHKTLGTKAVCSVLTDTNIAQKGEGAFFYCADNIYDEAKQIAAEISALKVDYGDIAIICRSLDNYETAFAHELALFDIPYYLDKNITAENTAPAGLLRAILAVAIRGINTENILRLFKTGLCECDKALLQQLENYAYIWDLKSEDWEKSFTLSPSGFGEKSDNDVQKLAELEALRGKIVPELQQIVNTSRRASAEDISKNIYNFIIKFGAQEALENMICLLEQNGDKAKADQLLASWNCTIDILSNMKELFVDEIIQAREYDELLCVLLRSTKIGTVPQEQNSVIITSADRMRLGTPKVCFVAGVNEGVFPMEIGFSGILTHADRELLISRGADMPGGFEKRALLEQMFFYRASAAASDKVFFSYVNEQQLSPPSEPLVKIVTALSLSEQKPSLLMRSATPAAALDVAAGMQGEGGKKLAALYKAIWLEGSQQQGVKAMHLAQCKEDFNISEPGVIKSVLGNQISVSPTRTEQYYKCAFAYFLRYVLGISARRKAKLSPLESGSLVHYVMEKALQAEKDFTLLSDDEIKALANNAADEYINKCMPDSSMRFANLIIRIKNSVVKLLLFVRDEQRQSEFRPVALELEIGGNGIKPITLNLQTGEKVQIVGRVDRVDLMVKNDKKYIRVLDYKTGDKDFDLEEVYCGLNTQMLLYLDAIIKSGDERFANAISAGVIYLSGDPLPAVSTRTDEPCKVYKLDGIILDEADVIEATDSEATGVFFPFTYKNNVVSSSQKLASLEKLGRIERHVEDMVTQMAYKLYAGQIAAKPMSDKKYRPCDRCDYRAVCLHEDGVNETKVSAPKNVFDSDIAKEQG